MTASGVDIIRRKYVQQGTYYVYMLLSCSNEPPAVGARRVTAAHPGEQIGISVAGAGETIPPARLPHLIPGRRRRGRAGRRARRGRRVAATESCARCATRAIVVTSRCAGRRASARYSSGARSRPRRVSSRRRTERHGWRRGGVIPHAAGFARSGPNACAWRSGRAAAPPADGAEVVLPCAQREPLAMRRGRRDAPRAKLGRRGPEGGSGRFRRLSLPGWRRGADWREAGSDRRPMRPPGQWRQGDC